MDGRMLQSHIAFFPTKATVKLDNGNMGHAQGFVIVLCCLTNCSIVYPVVLF